MRNGDAVTLALTHPACARRRSALRRAGTRSTGDI